METKPYFVIMAGGRGERFWPVSREKTPKQLLKLLGDRSFLQETVDRLNTLTDPTHIFIVTNEAQAAEVRKQLPELPPENTVAEPCGRDTCAAVALGAALVGAKDPDAVFAVLPADHVIPDARKFQTVLVDSLSYARQSQEIVTIGIEPTEPATGYGYIQRSAPISEAKGPTPIFRGARFVEKPNLRTAQSYLDSGDYRWNAGMFVWSFSAIHAALQAHTPEMATACDRWIQAIQKGTLKETLESDYPALTKISIDFAIMEKVDKFAVADGAFDWDDLGAWTALPRHLPADLNNNCVAGTFRGVDANNNIIYDARTQSNGLIALVDIHDAIVVQTDDATLIASQKNAQKIKDLVKELGADEALKQLT